jgi:glutathione S-transferase
MRVRLYVVAASHPCWAVARALAVKAIPYTRVEWPPVMHVPMQLLRFHGRTVPGIVIDGERVLGSRPIMHRVDGLVAQPRLYPPGTRVEEADAWGDAVLQPIPRRLVWCALRRRPAAILSYAEASILPFPAIVTRAVTPLIAPAEWALNAVSEGAVRDDLRGLPSHLDRVDQLIAEGVIGGDPPNAADLQIGASIALLRTLADVRPLIGGRPCERLARDHFPAFPGDVPAGMLPVV